MNLPTVSHNSNQHALVIGASAVDIVGRLELAPQMGTSNPARIRFSYGGVARNVAENLARLGQPVSLITVVGRDDVGEHMLEQTASVGVDISCCLRTSSYATGTYLAVLDKNGQRYMGLDDMEIIKALSPEYIHRHADMIKQAGLVFLDANLSPATIRAIVGLARRSGVPVCADPAASALAPRLLPYLSRFYLVTPNSKEASILTQSDISITDIDSGLRAARALVMQGVQVVVLPLAEYGVCYASSETSGHIPAVRTTILDPTGAGDALTATILFALLNDISLDEAVRLGVSAASLTLKSSGTVAQDLTLEKLYNELVI
jgi:pseudouridine kinase